MSGSDDPEAAELELVPEADGAVGVELLPPPLPALEVPPLEPLEPPDDDAPFTTTVPFMFGWIAQM